jgi:hypothetical protein
MTDTKDDGSLSEETRRAIFLALVELQDAGASVEESVSGIALRFDVTPKQVQDIAGEGLDGDWPPLCDESTPSALTPADTREQR